MDARKAIREVIESIPNLFGITRGVTIGAEGQTETVVYTQAQVADIIASILPDALKAKGHLMIALPAIETDSAGRRYIPVPITAHPWAEGEVRISPRGDEVAIAKYTTRTAHAGRSSSGCGADGCSHYLASRPRGHGHSNETPLNR